MSVCSFEMYQLIHGHNSPYGDVLIHPGLTKSGFMWIEGGGSPFRIDLEFAAIFISIAQNVMLPHSYTKCVVDFLQKLEKSGLFDRRSYS